MRPTIPILIGLALWGIAVDARRVRVRPVGGGDFEQNPQQVEYYAEQPEDDNGPILVSRQDTYGRATGQARISPRLKPDTARQPPVQTIRNYNKLNDDGSFTFGYESADGSFKEETRGTDCVVRGKYGYVDPDGNKREFTYVSGNPCDPNAVNQEEEDLPTLDSGEENIPQNIPRRPLKPRPTTRPNRPTTTVFQQSYSSNEEEDDEEENIPALPIRPIQQKPVYQPKPLYTPKPTVVYSQPSYSADSDFQSQIFRSSTQRPKATYISQPTSAKPAIRITPRPALSSTVEPATTYRPQLLQVSPSPTATAYTKQIRPVSSTTPSTIDFNEELKKFQLENNVISSTERPSKGGVTSEPIYSSELVYDPTSGQYNTVLYQQLSQTNGGELNLKQRLQPFVETPFAPRPFIPQTRPQLYQQQALFQQQQAALLQQSQQLFAQQQQQKKHQHKVATPVAASVRYESPRAISSGFPSSLLQQEPQQFQPISPPQRYSIPKAAATTPQRYQFPQAQTPIAQYYYVSPQGVGSGSNLAAGQIDAFLRGQSLTV